MKIIIPSYIEEINETENVFSYSYLTHGDNEVETMVRIDALPVEKRIFDSIELVSITMPRVINFIEAFNDFLKTANIRYVTLCPMRLGVNEDNSYELEWIYNYFRVYYSFDANGEDTYGFVDSNPEKGESNSSFKTMREEEYRAIAE